MKLAVMQPYFLPYIGYFQLMHAADKFVVFDDVHFINRGWINRNRILVNGEPSLLTLPVSKASQNRKICDLELVADDGWKKKLLSRVHQSYAKAERFAEAIDIFGGIMNHSASNLSAFVRHSLMTISRTLGIDTEIVPSSTRYENAPLKGADRILDICRQEKATVYVNASGGRDLYDHTLFERAGLKLEFIIPALTPYEQNREPFTPGLSILDVLMFNSIERAREMVTEYSIL
jgi:hypothetical protein